MAAPLCGAAHPAHLKAVPGGNLREAAAALRDACRVDVKRPEAREVAVAAAAAVRKGGGVAAVRQRAPHVG